MQQQEYNVADTRSNKDNYQPMLLSSVLCGWEAAQKQFCAHHRLPKSQTGLDVTKDAHVRRPPPRRTCARGAFTYYITRDGGSGVFKQGGASVQIYAPPLHPRDGVFAGVLILLTFNWSNCISGQIIKNYFFIWWFFTNCNPKIFFRRKPILFFLKYFIDSQNHGYEFRI